MARFRNLTGDHLQIVYGVAAPTVVAPDEVVDVDDDTADAYECQPSTWGPAPDSTPKSATGEESA